MMLGRTAKKSSKFEDSDSHMSRPRAVTAEPAPHRPSPRVPLRLKTAAPAPAAGSSVGRGAAPRSPLHEKKPAGSGAGSRVTELEAKLGKAHVQLTEMREQLAAAEKFRKDARAALVDAKKSFSLKKRDAAATSPPVEVEANARAGQRQKAAVTDHVADEEKTGVVSPAADALEAADNGEVDEIAIVADGDGNRGGSQEVEQLSAKLTAKDTEVDQLSAKLTAKDTEVEQLSAKLTAMDTEVEQLRAKLMAKDTEVYELRAKLMVKDAEVAELQATLAAMDTKADELTAKLKANDEELAALEGDNADLTKVADEASQSAKETAMRLRETEHALRESAAREARAAERLRASERAREALETEMQRSRAQSEQWRKAAEEAALVLGGGAEYHAGGRDVDVEKPRRHSSTGGGGGAGERIAKETDDDGSGGKRRAGATGGAMRVLSDLWKKKGHR